MLYSGVNHFNWTVNNYGSILPTSSSTTLTADGSAHTKGSTSEMLVGVAYDVWGIALCFSLGTTDATIRRQLTDIMIDPAAGVGNSGSSWSVLIDNIYTGQPATTTGVNGHEFYFPIFIAAGTAIGARVQDVVGGATVRCGIKVFGQPTRPELLRVSTKVQTIGANTGTTAGTAVTPGSSGLGSYSSSFGTLTNDAWWWQLGVGSGDTSMNTAFYRFDVAHDATAKYICLSNMSYGVTNSTGEVSYKNAMGEGLPIRHAPSGTDVYVRGGCGGSPDSNFTAVVYAVG